MCCVKTSIDLTFEYLMSYSKYLTEYFQKTNRRVLMFICDRLQHTLLLGLVPKNITVQVARNFKQVYHLPGVVYTGEFYAWKERSGGWLGDSVTWYDVRERSVAAAVGWAPPSWAKNLLQLGVRTSSSRLRNSVSVIGDHRPGHTYEQTLCCTTPFLAANLCYLSIAKQEFQTPLESKDS